MDQKPDYVVRIADWRQDEDGIARLRRAVFIDEQRVPETLEWESIDPDCSWFVAQTGEKSVRQVVGIVRLTPEGRIGRMAVLTAWRGKGVGSALMRAVLNHAKGMGLMEVHLSAQVHALSFYSRFGFVAEGEVYMDAGIPHRTMRLRGFEASSDITEQKLQKE